ncbi:MAG: BatA domain-containing protein [Planctomycetaceae bacterium]
MGFAFINYAMLAGLVAVGLPVIAHLLSKRKFDVVQWGAMQFLELGKKTRRRIRLQDWLLLLLRMLLVALVALALARPWGQGGIFATLSDGASRDVVFVIDSSYSTGWEGKAITPHAASIDWIHTALEDLNPGDTAALIDARTRTRPLIVPATTDFGRVREQLNDLPAPSGTSDLSFAITEAMQILSTSSNVSREVIVLTDGQALPWHLEDQARWERIEDLRQQPSIPPKVYAIDVAGKRGDSTNFSVDRVELSRNVTVPDFPIRLRATVRQSGGDNIQRNVFLEIDGQRLPAKATEVALLPNGEALVEFEHRFDAVGTYIMSVSLDEDNLPADNMASAVVTVADGIPVLLIDGDPQLDPLKQETFFLKSAFGATGDSPWIRADVIKADELATVQLADYRVVFLCNCPSITQADADRLVQFAETGGGVVIAPGDLVNGQAWNKLTLTETVPLLPLDFVKIEQEDATAEESVTVDHQTLQVPWLERFRKERGIDFAETRFSRWWGLTPRVAAAENQPAEEGGDATVSVPPAQTLAKLSNDATLLASRDWGDGQIVQFAVPLDADWSTLPARNDYLSFVHELVFALTATGPRRNVNVSDPLLLPLPPNTKTADWVVSGPTGNSLPLAEVRLADAPTLSYADADIAGTYYFHLATDIPESGEPFVVDFDRSESDVSQLDDAQWAAITDSGTIVRAEEMTNITDQLKQENSRTELWWLLLFGVFGLLVIEVAMTRQMVLGGHAALDVEPAAA